jgi:uncharacterized protein
MNNWLFAALALAFIGPACAETQPTPIHPALFVIRDADSTIYLFGTIHVRQAGQDWGGPEAHAALASADDVWTELEISPEGDAQGQRLMMQYGMAPAGHPLSSYFSAAENQRLNALTARLGLAPNTLEPYQPWLAAITLSIVPLLREGYDPNSGVDRSIDAIGDASHKHMRAFETYEQQIGFLANLSPDLQRQMVLDTVDEADEGAQLIADMTRAWERGDERRLQHLVVDETREEYPELYNVLFKQRNAAWIETLQHELQGSGVDFVAVGAGHLLGPDGLVEQLRARGIRVQRVRPAR